MSVLFSPPNLYDSARWRGMRVGLLGGSFDPPHEGHVHISLLTLKKLKLDAVWWLVSPQNPLKPQTMFGFDDRVMLCHDKTVTHPRILTTGLERDLGTSYTIDTVTALRKHYPRTAFVWITGMDNALTLHKWKEWRRILDHIATAHIARPPVETLVQQCPLKQIRTQRHVFIGSAVLAPLLPRTSYWIIQERTLSVSSTRLRQTEVSKPSST